MSAVAMAVPQVTMYTTGWCPYCFRARALLERKGITWSEIDLDAEPGRRDEMEARSGRRSVPQIFIGERHVGGADELAELERRGELEQLLELRTG